MNGPRLRLDEPIELGPFRIQEIVGRGGMGVVWRGLHAEQAVDVALKVLPGRLSHRDTYLSTFRDEVRKIAQFSHPSIVIVFDYGEVPREQALRCRRQLEEAEGLADALDAGSPYLVMEYCPGGSLKQRRKMLNWDDVRAILLSLLDALAHAHARGVVHRDIKPDNILFGTAPSGSPLVKLTDFGIALSTGDHATTFENRIVGTLPYMAPEQFDDWREHGPWSDLYSLGCVAYELATGRPPFHGRGPAEYAGQHLFSRPRPLSLPSGWPLEYEAWVLRLLEKKPRDRFQCAADAAFALSALGDQTRPDTSTFTAEMTTISLSGDVLDDEVERPVTAMESEPPTDGPGAAVHPMPAVPAPTPIQWRAADPPLTAMSLIGAGVGLYEWRSVPLVDRMSQRDHAWEQLLRVRRGGRARVVLLRGESGYGKTRLAEWMARRSLEVGASSTTLRAEHSPIPGPRHGLCPMIADALRCADLDEQAMQLRIDQVLARYGIEDRHESAALREILEHGTAGFPVLATPQERHAVLRRFLAMLADERAVVMLLEDVQWGSDALAFAQHVLETRKEHPLPLLIVATVRDEALSQRPLERELLAEITRLSGVTELTIGPLSDADQLELIQRLLRLEGPLARQVVDRTGGNPLFAVQLVGDWVRRGVLRAGRSGFQLAPGERAAVPGSIHDLWRGRLEQVLGSRLRDALPPLQVAAALGMEIHDSEWLAASAALGVTIPEGVVEALLSAHLAESREEGWAFSHGMLRESIQADAVAAGVWARVNRACADMLADAGERRGRNERIGRHLVEADDLEASLAPLLTGAVERLDTSDYRKALELLDLHEAILGRLAIPARDGRWGDLWIARVRALAGLGDLEEAGRLATRTAETARRQRWTGHYPVALRYQAMALWKQGDLNLAETVLVRARSEARRARDTVEEARSMMHLAALTRMLGDSERALEFAEEAYPLLRQAALDEGVADCLLELGNIHLSRGALDQAEERLLGALERYQRLGNRFGIAQIHNSLADIQRRRGRLEDADRQYEKAQRMLERLESPDRVVPLLNRALVQLHRRDHDAARTHLAAGLEIVGRAGQRQLQAYFRTALLPCAAAAGAWSDWDDHMREATALLAETGAADADLAGPAQRAGEMALEAGQPARALDAFLLARDQWSALRRDAEADALEASIEACRRALAGP